MRRNIARDLTGVALALLLPGPVTWAADAPAESTADVPGTNALEEIVVTAQRRAQKIQDVAGSITALGESQLKSEGISSIREITQRVAGLDFGESFGANFVTLRGVGLAVDTGVAEPNIALYVDGIVLPRVTMSTLAPIDLQRVEVLRGPQGTLYGRNATGGAINYVSAAPSDTFGGRIEGSYGSFDTADLKARITGPLSDGIRFSLSGDYSDRGRGYVENIFRGGTVDKNEAFGFRGALSADVTEKFTADFSVSYQRERFQSVTELLHPPGATNPPLDTAVKTFATYETADDFNPWSWRSTLLARAEFNYHITDDINLKSLTGYVDHRFVNFADGDGTSAPLTIVDDRQQPSKSTSQEFDLQGALPDRGSWLVGLYYFGENATNNIPVTTETGLPAFGLPPGTLLVNYLREKTKTFAAFSDVTVGLTDRFRLYAGARLSKEIKDFTQTAGAIIPEVPPSLTLGCVNQESSKSVYNFSPRAGTQFDFADGVMGYAQFSEGFKSGGLNSSICGNYYEPEKLKSYEVGVKSQFLGGRGIFNVSLFHYDYTGLQIFRTLLISSLIDNADSRTWGADFETSLRITNNWEVDASGTFLDSKFTNYQSLDSANPALGVQDLSGATTPRAPRYSFNLGVEADYPVQVGPFTLLSVRADARFSGKLYFQPYNTPGYEQPAYTIVNLNANLTTADDRFTVRAYVRNLTDEAVLADAGYTTVEGAYYGAYQAPRTYGFELIYNF